jgi:hypothetical protein
MVCLTVALASHFGPVVPQWSDSLETGSHQRRRKNRNLDKNRDKNRTRSGTGQEPVNKRKPVHNVNAFNQRRPANNRNPVNRNLLQRRSPVSSLSLFLAVRLAEIGKVAAGLFRSLHPEGDDGNGDDGDDNWDPSWSTPSFHTPMLAGQ